jgi:hypothetical protein
MITSKTEAYTVVQPSNLDDNSSINILEFSKELIENYPIFKSVNLIIDFSDNFNVGLEEILLFSQIAMDHKNNNKSFVIVSGSFDIDKIMVVPTFKEAEDIIELEEIERDLGI